MFKFNLFKKAIATPNSIHVGDMVDLQTKQELHEKYLFTPDISRLQWYDNHLVFLYNECQKGQRAWDKFAFQKQCAGFTQSPDYVMYKKSLGKETYPFAIKITTDQILGRSSFLGQPAKISGQLVKACTSTVVDLDKYCLNTVCFERSKVIVDIPYRTRGTKTGKQFSEQRIAKVSAWMYVAKDSFWLPEINRHKQVKLYTANLGKDDLETQYYFFNEQFENQN